MTHKIPHGKQGIELDKTDSEGKSSPQMMVKEKTAVPVNSNNYKENEIMTSFVQSKKVAEKIIQNLPSNSVLNLKNTSETDIPKDDF